MLKEDMFRSLDKLIVSQQFHHYSIKVSGYLKSSLIFHLGTIAEGGFASNDMYWGIISRDVLPLEPFKRPILI